MTHVSWQSRKYTAGRLNEKNSALFLFHTALKNYKGVIGPLLEKIQKEIFQE